jgi:hypothetical protein
MSRMVAIKIFLTNESSSSDDEFLPNGPDDSSIRVSHPHRRYSIDLPIIRRTIEQAKCVLNDNGGGYDRKLVAFESIIGFDSTVDNTNTAYKSMAKLWSLILNETQRLQSEHRIIAALLELGNFIHDYLLPYADQVSIRYHINIEKFHEKWIRQGCVVHQNTTESRLIYQTCRQVNPIMTPMELAQENVKIQCSGTEGFPRVI